MSPWRRRAARRLQPDANLTTCRSCASCGESREIVVSDAAAQRYDAELDRGLDLYDADDFVR